ncbi:MAG: glycoside hydrolase family 16 protein, partial [Gracilimonas sp.]
YKDTPGLLLYLLGNENNYGLFWKGAETEDIPVEEQGSEARAKAMYKLFNKAILEMKSIDNSRPVAFCNGDLQFLHIIAEEVTAADIFGTNTYRGITFTGLYNRVKDEYGKPVLLTEFGSDALNAQTKQLDQFAQATYLKGNWKEIYSNAAGMGNSGIAIGGFTFQFSDGWWKHDQNENLTVHDTHASWSNGGYQFDYVEGENNMNEEWFGITAKGFPDSTGFYKLAPRTAYYVLNEVHKFDPYAEYASADSLTAYFADISIDESQSLSCKTPFKKYSENEDWDLVWSDEFDGLQGQSPDSTKWTYDIGNGWHGWGNQELEYYTDRPENVSMDGNGNLVITARKEKISDFEYTSSRIKTLGLFEQAYGRFEARIKLPEGQGIWPAFWSLGADFSEVGWPESG